MDASNCAVSFLEHVRRFIRAARKTRRRDIFLVAQPGPCRKQHMAGDSIIAANFAVTSRRLPGSLKPRQIRGTPCWLRGIRSLVVHEFAIGSFDRHLGARQAL